ncbi:MAG TPA: hypothetical protein VG847_09775 [Chitinophagaceae bacterium]|nr:hypothetical protein [Chitinophagaceae bacterium]
MKLLLPLNFSVVLFCLTACAGRNSNADIDTSLIDSSRISKNFTPDTFETGKVIPNVVCHTDASQSYALYLPAESKNRALPVVYFFDPHGDGSLPLVKYKPLAEQYHFILAGSNNSKNGNDFPAADKIWENLLTDTKNRLRIDVSQVYVCGFSGGGKVASYLGLNHPEIKSVIAGGAGISLTGNGGNINFTFTALAGTGDMNMTDLVNINNELDKTTARHRIIFFNGIHEWAPENTMNTAFEGLLLDAMFKKIIPVNDSFANSYVAGAKAAVTGLLAEHNYTKAEAACTVAISLLTGVSDQVTWFEEKDKSIREDAAYQHQYSTEQDLFTQEENIKNNYQQHFESGDMAYWQNTIDNVKQKAKSPTPEGAMYQRLQAYLSLAFYSVANQLINNQRNDDARHFVELYKLADPANSEAWYMSAILDARSNDAATANADLLKAVANGFADKNRLDNQAEFIQSGGKIDVQKIEQKIK